ncbi:MAG: FAD-dependent oxidoreductase [Thermoleophilia bacterium]|nr:FAD-dependent oxidoreductase [Thermoleophilia bacterium]
MNVESNNKSRIVILGAGLTGLSAAWKLSGQGYPVTVIDRNPFTGGLATTFSRDGYIFDYGPHRYHTRNDALVDEVADLLKGALDRRVRNTHFYFDNRYFQYPLKAENIFSVMDFRQVVKCAASYMAAAARRRVMPAKDRNFESWCKSRFGAELYNYFFGPYTEKVWGVPPTQMSVRWAAQRIAVESLWDAFVRLFNEKRQIRNPYEYTHSPYVSEFFYPMAGIGHICERLRAETESAGGRVRIGTNVDKLLLDGNGAASGVVVSSVGKVEEVPADFVISTLPINDLVLMAEPAAPREITAAAGNLRFRSTKFLFLMLNQHKVTSDHWIYFADNSVLFNRLSEMRNFTPMAAPWNRTSLTLEISCDRGDEIWDQSADWLYERCIDDLESAGLTDRSRVEGYWTERASTTYPVYLTDFDINLALTKRHLSGIENLITCGRQGLFTYVNMDHAMMMGFEAAEGVIEGKAQAALHLIGSEQLYFG